MEKQLLKDFLKAKESERTAFLALLPSYLDHQEAQLFKKALDYAAKRSDPFQCLPQDIILLILLQLSVGDLGRASQVCKNWRNIIYDAEQVWRALFRRSMLWREALPNSSPFTSRDRLQNMVVWHQQKLFPTLEAADSPRVCDKVRIEMVGDEIRGLIVIQTDTGEEAVVYRQKNLEAALEQCKLPDMHLFDAHLNVTCFCSSPWPLQRNDEDLGPVVFCGTREGQVACFTASHRPLWLVQALTASVKTIQAYNGLQALIAVSWQGDLVVLRATTGETWQTYSRELLSAHMPGVGEALPRRPSDMLFLDAAIVWNAETKTDALLVVFHSLNKVHLLTKFGPSCESDTPEVMTLYLTPTATEIQRFKIFRPVHSWGQQVFFLLEFCVWQYDTQSSNISLVFDCDYIEYFASPHHYFLVSVLPCAIVIGQLESTGCGCALLIKLGDKWRFQAHYQTIRLTSYEPAFVDEGRGLIYLASLPRKFLRLPLEGDFYG